MIGISKNWVYRRAKLAKTDYLIADEKASNLVTTWNTDKWDAELLGDLITEANIAYAIWMSWRKVAQKVRNGVPTILAVLSREFE